ncbi:MAG: hypothetical protein ABSF95_23325 [Verrucomicrobiota bacterium]|jgi:hypothetical protein
MSAHNLSAWLSPGRGAGAAATQAGPKPGPAARWTLPEYALGLALVQAWPLLLSVGAAQPAASAPPAPPQLKAEVRTDNEPGLLPMRRAFVSAGTNRFAFSIPEGFRPEFSNQNQVSLVSADYNTLLSFRIATHWPPANQGPESAPWRENVLRQRPFAKILQEFTLTAANQSGPAFDVAWSAPGGQQCRQRVAFIPSRAGTLEFSLMCGTEAFQKTQYDLNFILLTFRASDAEGKLDLPRFSSKY